VRERQHRHVHREAAVSGLAFVEAHAGHLGIGRLGPALMRRVVAGALPSMRKARKAQTSLGATLVAANAGDMISEVTLAMAAGVGLGAIAGVIHPYPTQAEVIKRAADAWRRSKLTPTAQKVLRGWFRLFRIYA